MSKEAQLNEALNFLANNWRHTASLREPIQAALDKLNEGSLEDQANAKVLETYLSYPGSDDAQSCTLSLLSALRVKEGRKAAGLPPRTRGKRYKAEIVLPTNELMRVMVANELGSASLSDIERAVIGFHGPGAVERTNKKFIGELRPRAKKKANLLKKFFDAFDSKKSLF